jgi:hypothetical protein
MSISNPPGSIEALEQRLFFVSEALKNGDVEDLVPRIADFHALVVALASGQALESGSVVLQPTAETTARLRVLGATLGHVREQLARRHGLVDQALKMVIPATHTPVYAKQSGPYGAGARSSGRFQTFTA